MVSEWDTISSRIGYGFDGMLYKESCGAEGVTLNTPDETLAATSRNPNRARWC